ncbi:MAG TPA: hypothetical protein VN665_00060 [Candidatus Paceibacterota bacterium]|nr:hypothetical protein [Candidatus Paceibacterota bacterium]
MKKAIILGALILFVTIPSLSLADQTTVSTQASIAGSVASLTVQSNTALPNSILDLELYDTSGNKVTQSYVTTDLPDGSLSCSWNVAAAAGAYILRIGVFNGNWTTLYNWNNNAATTSGGPFAGDNHITCSGAAIQPVFTSSASVQGSVAGSNGVFTTTVQSNKNISNVLIDTEAYDSSNNKVGQWFETDALSANTPLTVTHASSLPNAGNYFLKVGIFSPDWSKLYVWNNAAGTFTTVATTSSGGGSNPPPPPVTNAGIINPATQTVQPGASVDFTGHNFGHEETVLITRDGAAVSSAHADGGGNFSTGSISMPNANGTYVFTFDGQNSGIMGTSTIQIGPVSQPPPQSDFSFSIANSNAVPTQQVITNTNNQPLGAFTTTIEGESIVLQGMNLYIATSSTGPGLLQNVEIRNNNGQIIGGPYNAVYDSATGKQKVTFISPITFDLGTNIYKVVGMLPVSFTNGGTVNVITNPATDWGTATSSSSHIVETLPNTPVSLNSMTIQNVQASGALTVSTDASAPPYSLVAGGTTGVPVNVLRFHATNEPINLQKVGLKLTSGSAQDLTSVELFAGNNLLTPSGSSIPPGSLIGTVVFTGPNIVATSTLNTQVVVPDNADATVIVKVDIADIGTNQPGIEGDLVAVDFLNALGIGSNSGTNIYATQSGPGVAGVRMVNTLPIVSVGPVTLTISGGTNQVLKKFSLSASSFGSLGLSKLNFALATTSIAVTNLQLHAYTDSGYSTPANVPGSPSGQFGSTVNAVSSTGSLNFEQTSNPFEIGAGSTIYFALTGNVTPVADATTWSVSSTLLGDSMFDGMKQATIVNGNFIWSPNATGTTPFNQSDWTNGFGVQGLPQTGLTQTHSN